MSMAANVNKTIPRGKIKRKTTCGVMYSYSFPHFTCQDAWPCWTPSELVCTLKSRLITPTPVGFHVWGIVVPYVWCGGLMEKCSVFSGDCCGSEMSYCVVFHDFEIFLFIPSLSQKLAKTWRWDNALRSLNVIQMTDFLRINSLLAQLSWIKKWSTVCLFFCPKP